MNGKHEDCIDENCLCREGHNKQELENLFTDKMKEVLPSRAVLKQRIRENPEAYQFTLEKKLTDYANYIMGIYAFKTLTDTEEVLYYQEGVYNFRGEIIIKKECEELINDCSTHQANEVINIIRRRSYIKREEFNKDFSKMVVNNGILNLDTLELQEHTKEHLSTVKIPIDFDQKARCPMFLEFLKECLEPHDIITLIEGMANILTGNRENFEISMMWIGEGSNGKSTALKIITGVIGQDNCSNVSIHAMNYERFSVSQLEGKLVNICGDVANKELTNLGTFKQLVSADPIAAEKKGKDHYTLTNFSKMFFAANEMPNIIDNSDGAFRRIYVTKWKNQFLAGVNRIENYDKIILDNEKSGIFNLLIENYRTLIKNRGFRYKQHIAEVREMIKSEADKLLSFIQECLVKSPNAYIKKDLFYEVYQKFCSFNNYEVYSKQKLGANLPTYGILDDSKKLNGKAYRVWKNHSWNMESDFIKNTVKGIDSYA